MVTRTEALGIATDYIRQMSEHGIELELIEEETQERTFGWAFCYDSKAYLSTRDPAQLIAGNSRTLSWTGTTGRFTLREPRSR